MKVWSISTMLVCLAAGVVQAEPVPATGPVTSVIVYRGQALVTRSLTIPRAGGELELLVENLPEKILPESLYAQSEVNIRYRPMDNAEVHTEKTRITATLTTETETVNKHLNKRVAADIVEQIAILENERATALRDEGKIEQARGVLNDNVVYLRFNASALNSPALDKYATKNSSQAGKLDEANWNQNRKGMIEGQAAGKSQR